MTEIPISVAVMGPDVQWYCPHCLETFKDGIARIVHIQSKHNKKRGKK